MSKSKTVDGVRQCCRCKKFLPATGEFFSNAGLRKDGTRRLCSRCRACGNDVMKQQARKHMKNRRGDDPLTSKSCARCNEQRPLTRVWWYREASKEGWQPNCKPCVRAIGASTRYKVTPEQYEFLMGQSGGLCNICQKPEAMQYRGNRKHLCVDHCHDTGRVRGVLCHNCNWFAGMCEKDPSVYGAPKFLDYLRDPPAFKLLAALTR
jgi:hypothetical protein